MYRASTTTTIIIITIMIIIIIIIIIIIESRESSLDIAMGCGLDGPGLIPGSSRFLSSPQRLYRLWGPYRLLSRGYRGLFPRG
jgi:hypothetical protein